MESSNNSEEMSSVPQPHVDKAATNKVEMPNQGESRMIEDKLVGMLELLTEKLEEDSRAMLQVKTEPMDSDSTKDLLQGMESRNEDCVSNFPKCAKVECEKLNRKSVDSSVEQQSLKSEGGTISNGSLAAVITDHILTAMSDDIDALISSAEMDASAIVKQENAGNKGIKQIVSSNHLKPDKQMKLEDCLQAGIMCDKCSKLFPSVSLLELHRAKEHQRVFSLRSNTAMTSKSSSLSKTVPSKVSLLEVALTTCKTSSATQNEKLPMISPAFESSSTGAMAKSSKEASNAASSNSGVSQIIDDGKSSWYVVQKEQRPKFTCDLCGRQFGKKPVLQDHLRIHFGGGEDYKCKYCDRKFVTKRMRTSHVSYVHRKKRKLPGCSECKECGQRINNLYMARHRRKHADKDRFVCALCGKRFSLRARLQTHIISHTETILSCKICGRMFRKLSTFNGHMSGHKASTQCEMCGAKLGSKHALKLHMTTHTGEQPFVCEVCGRKFARKSNMLTHLKLHAGIRNIVCDICGKTFAQRWNLKKHMESCISKTAHLPAVVVHNAAC